MRLPLPAPSDVLGLPGAVVDTLRALGDAVPRVEALLLRAEDVATRVEVLLDRLDRLLPEERTASLTALTDQVPADLHAVLEVLDDLHQVVSGMPGADRARDRGADAHPQVQAPTPPSAAAGPAGSPVEG